MIDIAYATPAEREEIAQFMNTVFTRAKWDIDGWRRLVAGRWSGPEGRYAIRVRDGEKLVGVLGLVYSERETPRGRRTNADMTSWYILKEYRGQGIGQKMLALAIADPTVTVNNFSSAKGAVSVLLNAGFEVLDKERLVWLPHQPSQTFRVHDDPLNLGPELADVDRQVIADHAGLKLRPLAIETPDGLVVLVIYPQKKHDEFVTHEIMYLNDHAAFARHAHAIAGAVLPAQEAILSLDRRFAAEGINCDEVREFATPRFFHSRVTPRSEIDMLYSECVLLNIKIH